MTIGFAILPDNITHNYIRGLQWRLNQNLGIRISRQSPHITIKSPFETEALQGHLDYLEGLAEQLEPFG
jgi:2'-5' RNA ligase